MKRDIYIVEVPRTDSVDRLRVRSAIKEAVRTIRYLDPNWIGSYPYADGDTVKVKIRSRHEPPIK